MILVTGATGNVGGELVRILTDAGQPVRGLVRSERTLPGAAQAVVGNLDDPQSLKAAAEGVDDVFLLGGYDDMPAGLAALREAGVKRVVLLSSRAVVGGQESNAVTGMHMAAERAIRESGLAWTFLHPSGFMSNTLQWQPQLVEGDVVRATFGDVPITSVDPYDIAAVAARALTEPGHEGRTYAITGPEALLPADRVRILGEVLGRDLRFEPIPDENARGALALTLPEKYVEAFIRLFIDGEFDDSEVTSDVFDVTGRAPRTFAEWARAHADAFRAG